MKPKIWKIWIGENPIPEHFKQYTDTWSKIDGEIHTVTNDTVDDYLPELNFKELQQRLNYNNTVTNHYIRYYLMFKYGGIYLDLDVEVIKDSEIWYLEKPMFFAETLVPLWINNHVMVCNTPKQEVYWDFLMQRIWFMKDDPKIEINTGPGLITKMWPYFKGKYWYFAPQVTTPWNWNEKPDRSRITGQTIAVHHFAYSWKK